MGRASDKALSLAVSYATFWIHFYVLRLWTKSCAWPFKWNRFSSTYTWYLSCFYVSSRKLVFFFSFDLEHCLEKGWNRTSFSLSLLFNLQLNHCLWCQNAVESRCIISITRSCYIFYCNSPFLSSNSSHFNKEAKCKTRLVKMWFICMRINSFTLSLALKQRLGGWDWVGVVLKCIMELFWGTNFSPVA